MAIKKDQPKPLYPRTNEEWQQYCKDAMRILIANSANRDAS